MSPCTRWTTGGESDRAAILCGENYNQIATVNDALDGAFTTPGHEHDAAIRGQDWRDRDDRT